MNRVIFQSLQPYTFLQKSSFSDDKQSNLKDLLFSHQAITEQVQRHSIKRGEGKIFPSLEQFSTGQKKSKQKTGIDHERNTASATDYSYDSIKRLIPIQEKPTKRLRFLLLDSEIQHYQDN